MNPPQGLYADYLRRLGLRPRVPSLEALTELTGAHLVRVPFENVSKLYYRRRSGRREMPDLALFLDGIARFNFGGTCYANNYYLYRLLGNLGYRVRLCGADMSRPDVHLVIVVSVEGHEYVVDGGYGAPFLAPLPRDLARAHEISLGRERYVLAPQDGSGRSKLDLYRDGQLVHGYVVNPAARRIAEFSRVIEESFADSATFMNTLLIARFFPGRSVVLHNLTLTESEGATSRTFRFASRIDLPQAIEERFGIPAAVASEALEGIDFSGDAWGQP